MSAQISHSRKRIIRFFNNHLWLTHILRNTRKFCSPNTREHMNTFCSWLRKHLMHNMDISEQLFLLARGPSWNILTYQGYEINGNTFYTIAQDKRVPTKTVVFVWMPRTIIEKNTYYGYIEEIWELDYGPNFKVPLFRCQRVKLSGGGVTKDEYVMTIVDLNNLGYRDKPFVLA